MRFQWRGQLLQFLCLCFSLSLVRGMLTKLRKLIAQTTIIFDNILIMSVSIKEELTIIRESLICVLKSLGFLISTQKLVLSHQN